MNIVRVLTLCTVAAIGACNGDSGTPPAPKPAPHIAVPAPAKKGPSAEELTAGMVEAASQGKSQMPVQLKFDLRQRPTLGKPLDIDVAVVPQIDAGGGSIDIAGGDGLTLAPGTHELDLPGMEAGQVYRQTFTVTPTTDGVLLLSLGVLLKHDELVESRVFSIPLIVEH
jgi:hypothetical protein